MKKLHFTFSFKGDRTYIHGTDMFKLSTDYINKLGMKDISNIDASFHSIVKNQMDGFLIEDKNEFNIKEFSFILNFLSEGNKYILALKENNKSVTERYEYNESEIINQCTIDDKFKLITLSKDIKYTNIEKIVAMNKALLENMFRDAEGKWYFTRLQLNEPFLKDSYLKYSVRLVKNFKFRLTKSEILLDNKKIGYIYFSLV